MLARIAKTSDHVFQRAKLNVKQNIDTLIHNYLKKHLKVELENYTRGNYVFGVTVKLKLNNETISQESLTTR